MLKPSRCLSQKTFLWNQNPLGIRDQLPSFRICKQNLQKKKCKTNKCIRFFYICTKIPLDKLLDILYRIVDFVFKGGTRDYIITNKFVDHKRGHHFAYKFLLYNWLFSVGNIIIQVIGIPMGSNPVPFFANLLLATSKLSGLRRNVNREQSMLKKSIIPFTKWWQYLWKAL